MIQRTSPVSFKSTFLKTPLLDEVIKKRANVYDDHDAFEKRQLINAFDVIKNDGEDKVYELRITHEKKLFGERDKASLFASGKHIYRAPIKNAEDAILAHAGDLMRKGYDDSNFSVVEGEEKYYQACTAKDNALSAYAKGLNETLDKITKTFL